MKVIEYHPRVPTEVREAVQYYEEISQKLGDDFWNELTQALEYARQFPEHHHFDAGGHRRSNLKRFPYHFLFQEKEDRIRIIVVRHNRRDPKYGMRRK